MGFSYNKATCLKPQKEKYLSTFIIALATAVAMFIPYIILGKGYFIFYGDFNVQQIPFYQQCHQAVRDGNIFWSWTTDLGANFIGSYSFYLLGSPFFWLTIPFSNWMIPYLMGPLLILKFAFAALTAYCYIHRFTKTSSAAQLGGILYAFSGFSIYNIFFNHFHEAIIVFPLLLLSVELLLTENKRFVFALAVFLCAVTNYFFFFGMVVFTIIYFLVRLMSGAISIKPSQFFAMVFESVLGVAMAGVILLPSYLAVIGNSRVSDLLLGWNAIMYGKEQIYANIFQCFFFPPDIPARPVFFPNADVKWSSLGGWLPLFSMVGVFTFFSQRKNHWLKRVIGICIFMSAIPILNSAFYAFNSSYYARWFYMPILMMCLATVILTEDKNINWGFGYKWVLGITLAISLTIGLFPQKNDEGKLIFGLYSQDEDNTYLFRFWLSCLIAIFSLIILGLILKLIKKNRKAFYRASLACVCIISIIYGNVFIASGRSHSYDVEDVMIDQLIEANIDLDNSDNYRVDVYDGVDNTSMYLGLQGINAFHSIVPTSIFEFYDFIGIERSVGSRPEIEYPALRCLLSVKYLLNRKNGESFIGDDKEPKMTGYKYKKSDSGYYIYENENYIPYGFSYEYYMDEDFCESYSGDSIAAMMLKAILLSDEQIEKYGDLLNDINDLPIGYDSEEGRTTTLSLSDEAMAYDCERLAKTSADSFKIDNHGFTATVTRDKANLVFFSVPFDDGWSATVNGKSVKIEKVNVGFMAVKVDAGNSVIRFNYETPGLILGLQITAISSAVFLIYLLICFIYTRKHPLTADYPEGDELIKQWRTDDISEFDDEIYRANEISQKPSILDVSNISDPPVKNNFIGGFTITTDNLDDED